MTDVEAKRVCAAIMAWLNVHEFRAPLFLSWLAQEMMRLGLTPRDVVSGEAPLEVMRAAATVASARMHNGGPSQEAMEMELQRAGTPVGRLWTAVMHHAYDVADDLKSGGDVKDHLPRVQNERPQGVG